jgi:hypothetical protein
VSTTVDHVVRPQVAEGGDRIATADRAGPDVDGPAGLTLNDCRAPGSLFDELVSLNAREAKVDPRALGVRTLLHLPRVATAGGRVSKIQIERELSRSARLLRRDAAAVLQLVPDRKFALRELTFVENFDTVTAGKLFSSLHYLRSARSGSQNFALLDPVEGRPATLCSMSPFEWKRVGNQIYSQFGIPQEAVRDISRVYSCNVAPPNAISFLLARVRDSLSCRGRNIELLVTVVDPNMGFTGSSYRAANWQRWLTIEPRPYLYCDRRYISPRQLKQRFGTTNLAELTAKHPGHRFEQSRVRLLDSLIFCCRVKGETEAVPVTLQRRLRR